MKILYLLSAHVYSETAVEKFVNACAKEDYEPDETEIGVARYIGEEIEVPIIFDTATKMFRIIR